MPSNQQSISRISICSILVNKTQTKVHLQKNKLVKLVENDLISASNSKTIIELTPQTNFTIYKFQSYHNKSYKFHLYIKTKNQSFIILIDNINTFSFYIKQFSFYGMINGLQQIVSMKQLIGEGSFAQVYKIKTRYQTTFALKMFTKKSLAIQKNKLAFLNQVNLMRTLNSKYIAQIHGIFQTQENIYIQLQYFPLSLRQIVKRKLSIKTQKIIMKQIIQALIQLKNKNIAHRDLKPDNIMIRNLSQNKFQCVIIDFGLSTKINQEKYIFKRCGTPGFLPPQIIKMSSDSQKTTIACDMFSVGCIFFKVLTKKYIFNGKNNNQIVQKNKKMEIPWQKFDSFSLNQSELMLKMLEKDPLRRINPQLALNHKYFCDQIDDNDVIPQQNCDIIRKMRNIETNNNMQTRKFTFSLMQSFDTDNDSRGSYIYERISHIIRGANDSCGKLQGPLIQYTCKSLSNNIQSSEKAREKARVSRFSRIQTKTDKL